MPKTDQKIDLTTLISNGNWPLFKHGLEYFAWVKSTRHRRYYLICGKQFEYAWRFAALSPILLIVWAVTVCYWPCFQSWQLAAVFIAVNLAALLGVWAFLRRTGKYLRQLPNYPIAVIDRDKDLFCVRNHHRLPFVQTGVRRRSEKISDIQSFRELRAFKVTNGGQSVCDPCSRTPTFGALYLCRQSDEQAPQMLFAGSRIPYRVTQLFFGKLGIPVEDYVNRHILD